MILVTGRRSISFSVFSEFMTASLPAAQSSSHPAYSIPQPIKTVFTAEFKVGKNWDAAGKSSRRATRDRTEKNGDDDPVSENRSMRHDWKPQSLIRGRNESVRFVGEGRDRDRVEPRHRAGDRRGYCRGGRPGRDLRAQPRTMRGGRGSDPGQRRGGDRTDGAHLGQ